MGGQRLHRNILCGSEAKAYLQSFFSHATFVAEIRHAQWKKCLLKLYSLQTVALSRHMKKIKLV